MYNLKYPLDIQHTITDKKYLNLFSVLYTIAINNIKKYSNTIKTIDIYL